MIIENIITQERINLPELELVCNKMFSWKMFHVSPLMSKSYPAWWGVGGNADKSLHSDSNSGVDRDSEEDLGDGKEPGNDVR